jgi:hypothetical protein
MREASHVERFVAVAKYATTGSGIGVRMVLICTGHSISEAVLKRRRKLGTGFRSYFGK